MIDGTWRETVLMVFGEIGVIATVLSVFVAAEWLTAKWKRQRGIGNCL